MKNKEFHKLLKKNKSNSGFTLTELLVGLIMGTIVIGGLGFGLVQLLQNTRTGTAFTGARNESARALDFISDEVKRAVAIENISTNATGFNAAGKTVVFALDIPEVNGNSDPDGDGTLFGTDNDITTPERIVYFLETAAAPWQGPLVLHRWGPPLDGNGNYTDGAWAEEALIDGINDTPLVAATINAQCNPAAPGRLFTSPAAPTGFYACIQDDDQDTFAENDLTIDTNGDGEINALDDDDIDSIGISAELYLTSGVDVGGANLDTYTANTQVVARARVAPADTSQNFTAITWSFEDIGGDYHGGGCPPWTIRTDFGSNSNNLDDTIPWIRNTNRQPQPIDIDPNRPLTITTSPIMSTNCRSRGNDYRIDSSTGTEELDANGNPIPTDGSEVLSQYDVKVSYTIDFGDPITFNGDRDNTTPYNVTQVDSTKPGVQFLKQGSDVPLYGGFDENGDGDLNDPDDQPTLGKFLYDQGRAVLKNSGDDLNDPATQFVIPIPDPLNPDPTIKFLGEDQRIIAFEVGQTTPTLGAQPNYGFDLQDNIFIITSEIFKKKFPPGCFSGSCPTGSP